MAPGTNTSTVVAPASGVDGPINRHATEYNVLPTLMSQSTPTLGRDQWSTRRSPRAA
jgi:hypothetical protein